MNAADQLIVFELDDARYALRLSAVERIVRAVEITFLPKAPDVVDGVINVQGRVIPVVNVRRRFALPERPMSASDQLIIARTRERPVALPVNAVVGLIERASEKTVVSENILPEMAYIEGVVKLEDGLVLIHNLDEFLSLEEERELEAALSRT